MKTIVAVIICAGAIDVFAASSRSRGQELLSRFEQGITGMVVTNQGECICTVLDAGDEYKYFSPVDNGCLRCVRIARKDGGVDIYKYRDGILDSASCTSTNLLTMVTTLFVGDGVTTGIVDRIEFDSVDGRLSGSMRLFDSEGRRIVRPLPTTDRRSSFDKEYIPKPGSTGRIGPYEWTIVGPGRESVLSRNGKKIIEANFAIGGKYPWIIGFGGESSERAKRKELVNTDIVPIDKHSGVDYYFVIDMRTDYVEYIPVTDREKIEKITGLNRNAYKTHGFWAYFLSKHGPRRLAALEEALKPPSE